MHLRSMRGYLLVEVMLGMTVMILIGAYLLRQSAQSSHEVSAKIYADNMLKVREAADSYAVANKSGIIAATDGTTPENYCKVNVNPADGTGGTVANNTTKKTCAVDVTWLIWKGYLPAGFKETTPEGSRWAAIYRQIDTQTLEGIVVAATTVGAVTVTPMATLAKQGSALDKAATLAGINAGIVPDGVSHPCPWHASDNTQRFICGTQGAWQAKLSDFVD
ncbi:MAG: hypothetical protein KJZ92_16585 [Rhodocyclaceae bacterium]|nr:hypothetical protein [Rhodocyclaceae bacterium]